MALDWLEHLARGLDRVEWWPVWIRDPDPNPPLRKPTKARRIIGLWWAWLAVIAAAGSLGGSVWLGYLNFP
jgi:hypothetical protein